MSIDYMDGQLDGQIVGWIDRQIDRQRHRDRDRDRDRDRQIDREREKEREREEVKLKARDVKYLIGQEDSYGTSLPYALLCLMISGATYPGVPM